MSAFKTEWLAALRSGEYEQVRGLLYCRPLLGPEGLCRFSCTLFGSCSFFGSCSWQARQGHGPDFNMIADWLETIDF